MHFSVEENAVICLHVRVPMPRYMYMCMPGGNSPMTSDHCLAPKSYKINIKTTPKMCPEQTILQVLLVST